MAEEAEAAGQAPCAPGVEMGGRSQPIRLRRGGVGALRSVGEGWWIAAPVALFPRDVPSSLTTSVIAHGSVVLRGSRRRWQQSRGPCVPGAQPPAPAPLSMLGLSPLPCSSLGWATAWHRVLPCLSQGGGLGTGASGTLAAALQVPTDLSR